jgi:hypothetical protein
VSIKFVCSCGKHLKARDEMARRRSICPRCGSLVGIPSREPTRPGGEAPLSLLDAAPGGERKTAHTSPSAVLAKVAATLAVPPEVPGIDRRVVHLLSLRGRRRPRPSEQRPLETHWYECLRYPLYAWRYALALAAFMALYSAGVARFAPPIIAEPPTDPWTLAAVRISGVLLLVLTIGVPCSFLDCVLVSAIHGEVEYLRWAGNLLLTFTRSGLRWMFCFLAGPVLFAVTGFLYWLDSGDPTPWDWLIVVELGTIAIALQMFVLMTLTDRGRLRDLNPVCVADLVHRLGPRALFVAGAAGVTALVHGWVLVVGVAAVHRTPGVGCTILAAGWLSGVFWGTFFFRLLGIWCFRSKPVATVPVPEIKGHA